MVLCCLCSILVKVSGLRCGVLRFVVVVFGGVVSWLEGLWCVWEGVGVSLGQFFWVGYYFRVWLGICGWR